MKNNKIFIPVLISCIIFFGVLGALFGPTIYSNKNVKTTNELGTEWAKPTNLQEALYGVDLIVRGTVVKVDPVEKRDNGIPGKGNYKYDVTPAIISVAETVYGEEPSLNEITYLQHGVENSMDSSHFVHEGDSVLLLLTKTTDDKYWSYNFDDGIWKIIKGRMESNTQNDLLGKLKNSDLEYFKKIITKAAKEQKKVDQ